MDTRDALIDKLRREIERAGERLHELEAAGRSRAANQDLRDAVAARRDQAREVLARLDATAADDQQIQAEAEQRLERLHVTLER